MKDVETKKKKKNIRCWGGGYGAVRVADDGNAYSWQMDFGERVSEVGAETKKNSLKRKEKRKTEDGNELKTRKKDEQVPKKKQ